MDRPNFAILTSLDSGEAIVNIDDQIYAEINDDGDTVIYNDNFGVEVEQSIPVVLAGVSWVRLERPNGVPVWVNPAKIRGILPNRTNTAALVMTYGDHEIEVSGSLAQVLALLRGDSAEPKAATTSVSAAARPINTKKEREMKSFASTGGKTFVWVENRGGGGFVNIDTIHGAATMEDGTTKIIGDGLSELVTSTPVGDIVYAAPSQFLPVTLGVSGKSDLRERRVWLNHESISGFADMGGGQVVIFTDAMPAPMPVLETINQLESLLLGDQKPAAVAA